MSETAGMSDLLVAPGVQRWKDGGGGSGGREEGRQSIERGGERIWSVLVKSEN